jgi:hypothetical protein
VSLLIHSSPSSGFDGGDADTVTLGGLLTIVRKLVPSSKTVNLWKSIASLVGEIRLPLSYTVIVPPPLPCITDHTVPLYVYILSSVVL